MLIFAGTNEEHGWHAHARKPAFCSKCLHQTVRSPRHPRRGPGDSNGDPLDQFSSVLCLRRSANSLAL